MCKRNFYNSPLFALDINQTNKKTKISMRLKDQIVNTRHIPHTLSFLERHFPSVLNTECFNESNFSFREEVVNTEIGHLFEHMILEELCALKIASGISRATHYGITSWNWEKEARGIFHISIDIGESEESVLTKAVEKSVILIEQLFALNELYEQPYALSVESI